MLSVGQPYHCVNIIYKGQKITAMQCTRCMGSGDVGEDRWVNTPFGKANFGYYLQCFKCQGSGNIVKAIHTRSKCLTPIVNAATGRMVY